MIVKIVYVYVLANLGDNTSCNVSVLMSKSRFAIWFKLITHNPLRIHILAQV